MKLTEISLDCGNKRSATPLRPGKSGWVSYQERRRRCALPGQSKKTAFLACALVVNALWLSRAATASVSVGELRCEYLQDPQGIDATIVFVPSKSTEAVMESGRQVDKSKAVKFLRMEDGRAVFEIGSGEYQFASR